MTPITQLPEELNWAILGGASYVANAAIIPAILASSTSRLSGFCSLSGGDDLLLCRLGVPRYLSYEELLKSSTIDAVYIALPNHLHSFYSQAAIEQGLAVLCEKPITRSGSELANLSFAAKQNGVLLREAYMTPFSIRTRALRQLLAQKYIGEITRIDATFTFSLNPKPNYRWEKNLGGGVLGDLGIYVIEPLINHFGAPDDISVIDSKQQHGIDVTVVADLGWKSGKSASIRISFCEQEKQELTYFGTLGQISANKPFTPGLLDTDLSVQVGKTHEFIVCDASDPYMEMIDSFVKEVRGHGNSLFDLENSKVVIGVVDLIEAQLR